jgi:hypothetical protein
MSWLVLEFFVINYDEESLPFSNWEEEGIRQVTATGTLSIANSLHLVQNALVCYFFSSFFVATSRGSRPSLEMSSNVTTDTTSHTNERKFVRLLNLLSITP